MRNLRRLALEIRILESMYGFNSVYYPEDGAWIKLLDLRLPHGRYNLRACTVLILIPENYDTAEVVECYLDKDLCGKKGNSFVKLPHSHQRGFSGQGYQWVCFEPSGSNRADTGLLDFINTLRTYLSDPWKYQELQ